MNSVLRLHLTPLKLGTTFLESSELVIENIYSKQLLLSSFSENLDYGFALEMRQAKPSTLHVSVRAHKPDFFFSGFPFCNCISCIFNCDDLVCIYYYYYYNHHHYSLTLFQD